MALTFWLVGSGFVLMWCGTWVLQIAVALLQIVLRLAAGLSVLAFGLVSILALALLDRAELRRIWRRGRTDAAVASILARERWS